MSEQRIKLIVVIAAMVLALAVPLVLSGKMPGWPYEHYQAHRQTFD